MKKTEKSNRPELSFSNSNSAWQCYKANEIFKTISEKNYSHLPVLSASQEKGMVYRDDNGINIKYDEKNLQNYKRVLPGQFVIHLRSFQGGFAHSNIEGICSPAYTVIDFQDMHNQDTNFWASVFSSYDFIKRLETVTYGIRDGRSISFKDFSSLKFFVPSFQEQVLIGNFLKEIDINVSLHQHELTLLKQRKKAFLQKMFSQLDSAVPVIRFFEYQSDWERNLLGDVLISHPTKSYISELENDGKYEVIQQGDKPIVGYSSAKPYEHFEKVTLFGDHTVSLYKPRNSFLVSTDGVKILSGKDIDGNFFYSLLQKYRPKSQGYKRHLSILKNIIVSYPTDIREQQKIGQFFKQLDEDIALHEQKLEKLKEMKKAFLQKMFV